ncbi:MAG: hypothetical protein KatS3mg131_0505 [Candidatus Tectimicrobiota bacterium]|nr:MAG: hypothetical protein KatS3mg131_0505 [Candidatus Tectomicrobia bacterium]
MAQHVLSSAWLRQQAPQLHQRLAETLSLLQPATLPDAAALAAQVKLSGLNYEAALWRLLGGEGPEPTGLAADLKGQLLALRQRLAVLRTPAANVVLEHVEEALRQLERYQLANLFAQQQHQPLLVPLLLPSEVTRQTAWLLVHREGHRQRHDPQARWALSLILPTTALGELHVEARLQGAALATTLYVERPEVAAYLEPHLPALAAQLQALGFQARVACRLLPPAEAASAEAPGPQAPSVDCRV